MLGVTQYGCHKLSNPQHRGAVSARLEPRCLSVLLRRPTHSTVFFNKISHWKSNTAFAVALADGLATE